MDISNDILIQAAKGDMEAFKKVYDSTSGFVYNVVLRITGNAADAQEVTQDVFMKIYNNLKNFQFKSSFKTWVYRISVNTAINKYRSTSRDRNRRVEFETAVKTLGAKGAVNESIETEEAKRTLAILLSRLNHKQRDCIILREIQGLSYEEISRLLKININTVRSRLKRARLALLKQGKKAGLINELQ